MLDSEQQPLMDQREQAAVNSAGCAGGYSIIAREDEILCAVEHSSILPNLLDLLIEITRADSAHFFELDEAAGELVLTHIRGEDENQRLIGLRLNCRHGLPGISLHDPKIVMVGNLPTDPVWLRAVDPINAARLKNMINLPVANQGHTLGVIQILNFQQAELDLLVILSSRLGRELEHRRETDSVRRSNQRLLTLVDMLREVSGTLDRNQLLHQVTEHAARLVDAERSSLFLADPTTSEVFFQVAYQTPEQESAAPDAIEEKARPSRAKPAGQARISHAQAGEFSFFNRSVITVPLSSEPIGLDHAEIRKHVLGGIMVLNKSGADFQQEDAQLIHILANQASTFLQVADMIETSEELFLGVIKSLIASIDAKDPYTQGHSQRVSDYSVMIARELQFDEMTLNDIRVGSLLHDIGKIGIPDSILLKNGRLDADEMEVMRGHPHTGANILGKVKLLDPMRPAILEHHERLDGSGYPAKLKNSQISRMGRIVAVADVFDAMTSNRPYRKAISIKDVMAYLCEKSGILFDAGCVQALDAILARSS